MKFAPGDRVYYISNKYGASGPNPLKGSEHECQGTVYYANSSGTGVKWDNGRSNGYIKGDLELAANLDQNDPNILFRKRK